MQRRISNQLPVFQKLSGCCELRTGRGELIVECLVERSKSSRFVAVIDSRAQVIENIGGTAINRPIRSPVWFLMGLFSLIEKYERWKLQNGIQS